MAIVLFHVRLCLRYLIMLIFSKNMLNTVSLSYRFIDFCGIFSIIVGPHAFLDQVQKATSVGLFSRNCRQEFRFVSISSEEKY